MERTQEQRNAEIERLKEVNLVDFICNVYHFSIDQEKTKKENYNAANPKSVFLENESGDKLLVSRVFSDNHFIYKYRNLFNDLDCGNFLNFIKYRDKEKYTVPSAIKKIKNFVANMESGYYKSHGHEIIISSADQANNTENKIEQLRQKYMTLPVLNDTHYLEKRGLNKDLLHSDLLKDRIRNEYIYFPQISSSTKRQVKYTNTVFPIFALEKNKTLICGYVRKNHNLKMTAENSAQSIGIWLSNHRREEPVTHLVICENPIDNISYVQLKLDLTASNPLLVASNGEITDRQLEIYQEIVSRLKPETIVLANDNNCKGQLFNAKILATLGLPDKFQDAEYYRKNKLIVDANIHCGYHDQHTGKITWKFEHFKIEDNLNKADYVLEHIPSFQRVVEFYEQLNRDTFLENDQEYSFNIDKKFHSQSSVIQVTFDNSIANWVDINKSIMALKYDFSQHIMLDLPKNADWNDDLKVVSGIEKGHNQTGQEKVDDKENIQESQTQDNISPSL